MYASFIQYAEKWVLMDRSIGTPRKLKLMYSRVIVNQFFGNIRDREGS